MGPKEAYTTALTFITKLVEQGRYSAREIEDVADELDRLQKKLKQIRQE